MKILPDQLFRSFSRRRRFELSRLICETLLGGEVHDACLELGGPIDDLTGVVERFSRYVVLNLREEDLKNAEVQGHGGCHLLIGDATRLPFASGSFDFVISNALIEHVPYPARARLAEEVRRIARRGYFISAPNFWFPFEPHYMMPLFQYLPESLKRRLTSYVRIGGMDTAYYEPISLPTIREMRRLFPTASVGGLSFTGTVSETIFAWERLN